MIEILQPRWHDRKVLIATYKVGEHNHIKFIKTKNMPDIYYVAGRVVRKYPKESNGTIDCYAVPISELVKVSSEKKIPKQEAEYIKEQIQIKEQIRVNEKPCSQKALDDFKRQCKDIFNRARIKHNLE